MTRLRKQARFAFLAAASVAALIVSASAAEAASPNAATVFRARGTFASANLGEQVINGTSYLVYLTVSQDPATGDTRLLLRAITRYAGASRTEEYIWGSIPAADFTVAADLGSATLSTVVNTTATDFVNDDVGPISGLTIDLTWTAVASGHAITTSVIDYKAIGAAHTSTHEVVHTNGPFAECTVDGSFDALPIAGAVGTIEQDAEMDIYQTK
jgi:hypothetical protein